MAEIENVKEARNSATGAPENEEKSEAKKQINEPAAKHSAGITAEQSLIVYFEHNSNEISQNAYQTLDNIVKFTSQRPDSSITVIGFTDSKGDAVYNKQLSKYRADIVKNYLIGQGISPANIETIGKGPKNPVGDNETSEGRQMNRRVEIRVH